MKVKALRSFLVGLDDDGNRDVIEQGDVREMSEKQFKELQVHGLVEVKADEKKAKEDDSKKK